MTEPGLDPILAYLRENSGRYSLPALREQLLREGHAVDDVDLAIQIFQYEHPEALPRIWPWILSILLLDAGLTLVLSGSPRQQYWIVAVVVIALLIGFAEILLGLLLMIPRGFRPWGSVLLRGAGLFAAVGLLTLTGLCIPWPH